MCIVAVYKKPGWLQKCGGIEMEKVTRFLSYLILK
jgi:hypothetical protein